MSTCRICFEGADQGLLCSPCDCNGSSKYIHISCLLRWINTSDRSSCEICKTNFPLELEAEERCCDPSHTYHRLLANPFFHIFIQFLLCAIFRPVESYSMAVHLFFAQHLFTIAFYLLHILCQIRTFHRYVRMYTLTPVPFLHASLLFVLFLSRNLTNIDCPPLMLLFMSGCHIFLCFYPLQHVEIIQSMNRDRRIGLVL